MREPYDWNTGHCFVCGKLVRDGQGMQEVRGDEIVRFCWKNFKERCLNLAPAKAERAKVASRAEGKRSAAAVSAS